MLNRTNNSAFRPFVRQATHLENFLRIDQQLSARAETSRLFAPTKELELDFPLTTPDTAVAAVAGLQENRESEDSLMSDAASECCAKLSVQSSNKTVETEASSPAISPILVDKQINYDDSERDAEGSDAIEAELNIKALDFDDLNQCVAALLKKPKADSEAAREIKRRQRKDKDQVGILENEYAKDPNWSREYIKHISQKLHLRECQVYKWHWDQRKKDGFAASY